MIRLLFVGDGPRDRASVPPLVGTILDHPIDPESEFRDWGELRAGGFPRQVRYFTRVARDRRVSGMVAVVDADTAPARTRLKKLREGRDLDRATNAPFPCALGEARPHVDVWLLDDAVAVRRALRLPPDADVPAVGKTEDPKDTLNGLIHRSPARADDTDQSTLPLLASIAAAVDANRCANAKSTGFEAFNKDVVTEFRELVPKGR